MAKKQILAGRYLGVLDRVSEIKGLGAKAVMLTPVTLAGEGLGPMGRAPFSFFAPEPSFATASNPSAASVELKQLIKGLHDEGIEVYLQESTVPVSQNPLFYLCAEAISENTPTAGLLGPHKLGLHIMITQCLANLFNAGYAGCSSA